MPHQQQITANPFGVIGGWFNAEYERKLAEMWSVGLGGSHLSLDDSESISSASAAFRFYPQGAALSSFYVGPRVGFYRVDEVNDNPESSQHWVGVLTGCSSALTAPPMNTRTRPARWFIGPHASIPI